VSGAIRGIPHMTARADTMCMAETITKTGVYEY
jgi:hypothetical protein